MPPGKSPPANRKPAQAPSKPTTAPSKPSKAASKAIKTARARPKAATTVKVAAKPKAGATTPTEQAIRRRAYELYLARGGAPGDPQQDWDAAVNELRAPKRKLAAK